MLPTLPSDDQKLDVVDEASLESFPASDPPGWGSSHASTTPVTEPPQLEPAPSAWRGVLARWLDRLRGRSSTR